MDDIFVFFDKPEHLQQLNAYMEKENPNIIFSVETKKNDSLSSLDIRTYKVNEKFIPSVYGKDTFRGLDENFTCFNPSEYDFGLQCIIFHWCFYLVLDLLKFHMYIEKLKKVLHKNGYLEKFIGNAFSSS